MVMILIFIIFNSLLVAYSLLVSYNLYFILFEVYLQVFSSVLIVNGCKTGEKIKLKSFNYNLYSGGLLFLPITLFLDSLCSLLIVILFHILFSIVFNFILVPLFIKFFKSSHINIPSSIKPIVSEQSLSYNAPNKGKAFTARRIHVDYLPGFRNFCVNNNNGLITVLDSIDKKFIPWDYKKTQDECQFIVINFRRKIESTNNTFNLEMLKLLYVCGCIIWQKLVNNHYNIDFVYFLTHFILYNRLLWLNIANSCKTSCYIKDLVIEMDLHFWENQINKSTGLFKKDFLTMLIHGDLSFFLSLGLGFNIRHNSEPEIHYSDECLLWTRPNNKFLREFIKLWNKDVVYCIGNNKSLLTKELGFNSYEEAFKFAETIGGLNNYSFLDITNISETIDGYCSSLEC